MTDSYQPKAAIDDEVTLDTETYENLLQAAMTEERTHSVNESADKITLTTKTKRGSATRDQDDIKVRVKGNDAEETAMKLKDTLDALEICGVADTLRNTQPEVGDDE